tara:strand:- start:125 stop:1975 length:1851 start_codon:yes stop_codon:yes gene_type:complete
MITDLRKVLSEWAYRTKSGKPNPKSMAHQIILEGVLKDFGWDSEERNELLSSPSFLIETDIVKNKKSGNTYVVQKHNPDTQSLVKKDASKDDIKKVEKDKNGEEPEEKKTAQLNGYIGDKDKSVSEGDPSESEEYQKDHEPDDEEFESKNEKHKNPEPPPPLSLDGVIENPKFPKRYIKMLERMANSRLTTKTKKWEHFSDIPGGAGQIKAQAGELMTMIGSSLDDKEFDSLMNALEEHEERLKKDNVGSDGKPGIFQKVTGGRVIDNPGSRIIDKTWIQSARNNRKAILDRLQKQYGEGTKIIGAAWDAKDEVEAMGLSDYENNKGFSTDCYFKVEKPNGEQVVDEVSLKKSTKVNFLNSGAGDFENWDPDLPDEINQKVYRAKARKRNIDFIEQNRSKVDELLNSSKGEKVRKLMKSKKITFEQALQGNSRDKQNVLYGVIKELRLQGDEEANKIVEQDAEEHKEFVEQSVKAITENDKMRDGMLSTIRSEFPLKAVSDGEETMAIGPNSLDKETMKAIFGTDDYDEIKEKLVARPPKPILDKDGKEVKDKDGNIKMSPPFIGYNVEATGEVFPVAEVKIREDGRGYGGQFKFEMVLHKDFAPRLESAQKEIYG